MPFIPSAHNRMQATAAGAARRLMSAPAGWNPNQAHGVATHLAPAPTNYLAGPSRRTDMTQDIDGAFAQRNLGSKHYSEIARSGNGNMRNDLADYDTRDMRVLDGVGECYECMGLIESTRFDGLGAVGPGTGIAQYRYPTQGETPPYAPAFGFLWLRMLTPTGQKAAGGTNVSKAQWVLVSKGKLAVLVKQGNIQGTQGAGMSGFGPSSALPGMGGLGTLDMTTIGISAAIGIVGGIGLWFAMKGMKKSKAG